jgi:hypothetical protein
LKTWWRTCACTCTPLDTQSPLSPTLNTQPPPPPPLCPNQAHAAAGAHPAVPDFGVHCKMCSPQLCTKSCSNQRQHHLPGRHHRLTGSSSRLMSSTFKDSLRPSGGVEDQPQYRRLWRRRTPSARSPSPLATLLPHNIPFPASTSAWWPE